MEALRERDDARRIVVAAMGLLTKTRNAWVERTFNLVIATPITDVVRSEIGAPLAWFDGSDPSNGRASLPFDLSLSRNI